MSVSPSIVLTCGADVSSSGKHLFTLLEVRIDVLKRWRPAPFLGKFPFSTSLGKTFPRDALQLEILRWKKLRKKMVASQMFSSRARQLSNEVSPLNVLFV